MSTNYFIGDIHLDHKNICKYRPRFNTVEEHNDLIINNIRNCYGKRNHLWLLGDCFFSYDMKMIAKEMCNNFHTVNVTLGNHCTDKTERKRVIRELMIEHDNFSVHGIISKFGFWLSHAPIHPDEMYRKVANVHGHVHNNSIDDERYINVSCEAIDYKPITLEDIRIKAP